MNLELFKYVCPVEDCVRHVKGFESLKDKKHHIRTKHPEKVRRG